MVQSVLEAMIPGIGGEETQSESDANSFLCLFEPHSTTEFLPGTPKPQRPKGVTSKLPSRVRLTAGVGKGEALGGLSRPGPFRRLRRELLVREGAHMGWSE